MESKELIKGQAVHLERSMLSVETWQAAFGFGEQAPAPKESFLSFYIEFGNHVAPAGISAGKTTPSGPSCCHFLPATGSIAVQPAG